MDLLSARHAVSLAESSEGEAIPLRIGCVLLAAGSSGGGKSTFLMGLMERLCQCRYQYCSIDPEGDYDHMDGAVVLGRVVMAAGKVLAEHKAPGEITVHCLEGKIGFAAFGLTHELTAGQLVHLPAGEPHSVQCLEDASFLLTILRGP